MRTRSESAWAIVSQGTNTLSNFILTVAVARHSTLKTFAAFAIAYAFYVLASGLVQTGLAEAAIMRLSPATRTVDASELRRALVSASVVGIAFEGLYLMAVWAGLFARPSPGLYALVLACPALLLADVTRPLLVAQGKGRQATVALLPWALVTGILVTGAPVANLSPTLGGIVLSWVAGGLISTVLLIRRLSCSPGGSTRRNDSFVAPSASLSLSAEFLTTAGLLALMVWVVGAADKPDAAAGIRGAQILFTPLLLALTAIRFVAVSEARRAPHLRNRDQLLRWTVVCAGVGVAYSALAAVCLHAFGRLALGDVAAAVRPALPYASAYYIAMAASWPAGVFLRAEGRSASIGWGRGIAAGVAFAVIGVRARTLTAGDVFSATSIGAFLCLCVLYTDSQRRTNSPPAEDVSVAIHV